MEFMNKLQQQTKELEEEKNKLLISLSEKEEKIQVLESNYDRDMKLLKKKLNVVSTL